MNDLKGLLSHFASRTAEEMQAAYLPTLENAGSRNLHIWTLGSAEAIRHKIFRDWLRENAEDRRKYGDLKRELAQRPYDYVYECNNDKAPLIREIDERAQART